MCLRLLSNYCEEAFNDPEFNAFEEGLAVKTRSEQLTILLKNVPDQLKKHAVQGIMEKFGQVTRVHIVRSENNRGNLVFVDFTAFT